MRKGLSRWLIAAALLLPAVTRAAAAVPGWAYNRDGEAPREWLGIAFHDETGTKRTLWMYAGGHYARSNKDNPLFQSPDPAYDLILPLFDLSADGAPAINGDVSITRYQAAVTPFRVFVKFDPGRRMTVTKAGAPEFVRAIDLTKQLASGATLISGPAAETNNVLISVKPPDGTSPAGIAVSSPAIQALPTWQYQVNGESPDLWRSVTFEDPPRTPTLYFYDSHVSPSNKGKPEFDPRDPAFDIAVPLFALTAGQTDTAGTTAITRFAAAPSPYKLYVKFKTPKAPGKMAIKRNGSSFKLDAADSRWKNSPGGGKIGKLSDTVKPAAGQTALVAVTPPPPPPAPQAPPAGLTDFERTVAASMDPLSLKKAGDDCKAPASAATAVGPVTDCWRTHISDYVKAYRQNKPASISDFDPFELAYLRARLGETDFAKFNALFAKAKQDNKAVEFVKRYRDGISAEFDGYLNGTTGTFSGPQQQLRRMQDLLAEDCATAEACRATGNRAWGNGGATGASPVVVGNGGNGASAQLSNIPPGGRTDLAVKPPPTPIGKDMGPNDAGAPDKNANVDMIAGLKGAVWLGVIGFVFGGPIGFLIMGIMGYGLGWAMSKDINR